MWHNVKRLYVRKREQNVAFLSENENALSQKIRVLLKGQYHHDQQGMESEC